MASIRFGLVGECKAKKWVVKLARIDHKSLEIRDRYGLEFEYDLVATTPRLQGYESIRNEIGRYI